uniref:Uncharacterized protein n=1 Tax=Sphaerodactylus townsendi TaxID=933632 RepID=A0ACB8F4Q0_9SAUR
MREGESVISNLTHEEAEEIEANQQNFLAVAFGRVIVQGRAAPILALWSNRFVVFVILHRVGRIALPNNSWEQTKLRYGEKQNPADESAAAAAACRLLAQALGSQRGGGRGWRIHRLLLLSLTCSRLFKSGLKFFTPSQAEKGEGKKVRDSL